jgi:hypothetical protein
MEGVGAAGGSDDRGAWPRSSANADATPSSSSTSSTCMALMLSRVGHNLIDFGLFSLTRTELTRLALQLRAT